MAKVRKVYQNFIGGIADFDTLDDPGTYAFGRAIDVRSDPKQVTILPKTIKESGNVTIDLPKWSETYNDTLDLYIYGDAGSIYKRTSAGSHSLLRTVSESNGNGLVFSYEDYYLWYARDKVIGRYGPLNIGTAVFNDDYFGSVGGVPLNTFSGEFEAGSSQHAARADTASLSIIADLSMEVHINPESLPSSGSEQVLMAKWDESGTLKSYKFSIIGTSAAFGDGGDGALTISSNTTESPT